MPDARNLLAALAASASLCSCAKHGPPPIPAGLIAVVQYPEALSVRRQTNGVWHEEKRLPPDARALRFSRDGATVAWIQDVRDGADTVPLVHVQGPNDTRPRVLGTSGTRLKQAMGLAVSPAGHVLWLTTSGTVLDSVTGATVATGSEILLNEKGDTAWLDTLGCLEAPAMGISGSPCGDALRLIEYTGGTLLARNNRALWEIRRDNKVVIPASDTVDARLWRHSELLVVRRVTEAKSVSEVVEVRRPNEVPKEITRAAVIVSAGFDSDGSILVIRAASRKDLFELMLAHAPDEFGGEALPGEAVRFSPSRQVESQIPGLELQRVRALFYAVAGEPATSG
jgi:hypothetical protein